jgi:hypothetical protein
MWQGYTRPTSASDFLTQKTLQTKFSYNSPISSFAIFKFLRQFSTFGDSRNIKYFTKNCFQTFT